MRRCFSVILFFCFLSGCTYYAPPGENHPVRVVTRIDVSATQDGQLLQYHYTDTDKMETILQYLRNLKPDRSAPITPDTFRTDAYEIRLTLSDGSQTIYYQIYDEYLQKNGGPWQSIDSTKGAAIQQLLLILPSDSL